MKMKGLSRKSDEVLVCTDEIISLSGDVLPLLKEMSGKSPKKRARICTHKSVDATIQEMIISIIKGSYIRPHRHKKKSESFHLIEGAADIVVFENDGAIKEVIPFTSNGCFYYRLDDKYFHTIIVKSEHVIFHEVTNGPFVVSETEFANFSPRESGDGFLIYLDELESRISKWRAANDS